MSNTEQSGAVTARVYTKRHLLMCSPEYFTVAYSINPWMDMQTPVDRDLAMHQWLHLRQTYESLGHEVEVMHATPGLPDMVFTANGGIVNSGRVLVSRFAHPERHPETAEFLAWFKTHGYGSATVATASNEGEGDVLTIGGRMLAADGPRTSLRAHDELRDLFAMPVIGLDLVDPRFYHLDTAMAVLDEETIAYYPGAFSEASLKVFAELCPAAIRVSEADACGFGLNAMSDGLNILLSDRAPQFHAQLQAYGFRPLGVDMSELVKAGGSAKCCTLELRA